VQAAFASLIVWHPHAPSGATVPAAGRSDCRRWRFGGEDVRGGLVSGSRRLFPLVFLIFSRCFVVLLGPAVFAFKATLGG